MTIQRTANLFYGFEIPEPRVSCDGWCKSLTSYEVGELYMEDQSIRAYAEMHGNFRGSGDGVVFYVKPCGVIFPSGEEVSIGPTLPVVTLEQRAHVVALKEKVLADPDFQEHYTPDDVSDIGWFLVVDVS